MQEPMASSQPDSKIFSVRIVSIDYYMAPPIPNFDICYSNFQGGKVNEVPIIRIYGSTPSGQKTCLHVHRAFPYLYVPCSDIPLNQHQEGSAYTNAVSLAVEKALKLKSSAGSKRQHVHGCSLVRAKKFYGYHSPEELFVKIYLYHPHDVSRAANLLLGGAAFDKSLQPHESHIPFILQFLVDCNLYGMGHVHLSKIKFRHPVPDSFPRGKLNFDREHEIKLDMPAFISTDSPADLYVGDCFASPVWVSSTIPCGWTWDFSSELGTPLHQDDHSVKRQSICELEGDATIDDILNKQFITYTSLSQTRSDVKMVQSLIPIWEEEYERTGMHEAAVPPDPGKPLPEDVLKTLSHGLGFEQNIADYLVNSEENLALMEDDIKHIQSVTPLSNEGNFVELENVNSNCTDGQLPENWPLQGYVYEKEVNSGLVGTEDASPQLLSASNIQCSDTTGTSDTKATDKEALGLLKWLATSHAVEDINSDDELVPETILSPLLPAATIVKVLEKANIDYESESQKECQDILDSVEEKDGASDSVDHNHHPHSSSDKKIPQVDGLHSSPMGSAENPCMVELNSQSKRHSHYKVLQTTARNFSGKQKRKKSSWCSLLFSITQKVNDNPEAVRCNIVKLDDAEDKNYVGPNLAVNEGADDSVSLAETIDTHARETSSLVGCSLRDLMRQKRRRRVSQEDGGYVGVTKNYTEGEGDECNILLRKRLDLDTLQDDKAEEIRPGSLNVRPLESNKQTEHPNANFCKPVSSGFHLDSITHPACGSNSQLQAGSHLILGDSESKELQFPCRSKKHDLSIVLGHFESNNNKEFEFGDATKAETITNVCNLKSDFLSDNHLSEGKFVADKTLDHMDPAGSKCLSASPVEHVMFVTGSHEHKSGRGGRGSLQKLSEIPDENIVGMSVPVDATVPQSENFCAQKQQNDLPVFRGLVSVAVDVEGGNVDLTGMTSFKKAPIADWKQAASSSSSLSSTLSCHPAVVNEENKGGTSGSASDEILPFFEEDCKKKIGVEYKNSACNSQEEAILGIPTHYQNDGSVLYLLRPILSPPSTDCVNRWLAQNNRGVSEEIAAESAEHVHMKGSSEVGSQRSSTVDFNKELTKPDYVSHLMPIVDQAQQEINRKPQRESPRHCDDGHTVLQIEREIAKPKTFGDCSGDISQISGPDGRSRLTPLSQIGFRDPATTGAGQQLTLLSLEVQAESRGDLRSNPRFDPVNVLALAFQNDHEAGVDVYVFLHSRSEPDRRDSYGISGCKVFSFSDERKLFSHFIRTIGALDPDIIMGWDVQGGSLGFLAERAAHLGIGLLNKISRTPLEAKMGSKESEFSDNDILDTALHESLIGDSVLADDSVIEDEWGRTHASGVHVGGRVVLNIWRLMRGEVKLNLYTLEAVGEAVLRQKIPSFPDKVLTKWFASGPGRARYRCIEYVIERAQLNLEIMNRLDMINRTSELARVFGIDFFSVLSRGSQYRVESMFLRLAHTQNYLAISPGSQQVASQPAMECLPLVMEPESGFYKDPVIVLDFQSLYPSMIIGYNLCFCTCLGNVAPSKANTLGVSSFSPDPRALQDLKDKILLTPNGVMYVTSKVRKGILPRLLEEILSTRIMVKQAMKKLSSSQQVLYRIFNARQLALKLIANVTYGYTAAGFSGRMPCAELADSIVQCGRNTLEKAISLVNANDKWKAKVVYGDTDSMFVLLKGRSVKEAFQIGREIASAVTAINPDPVTLKLEKVYHPCFLLTKKRYVGYSYESADQIEPVFDAKGIETVRRDTCSAVAKTMERSLRLFFEHQDISEVKTYLQRQWTRILSGRVSIQDFVFAKEVRLGTYSARTASLPPAAIVATKAIRADPRAEPCYGERVPYVVVHGEPGARLVDMVVDPLELLAIDSPFRLNDIYYITKQIIPALQRVFGLVGADLNQWFLEMPRPVREAFSKRPMCAPNPQRTRIDFYYMSKHCVLCGELVQASTRICNKCMQKEDAAATALIGRTSKLEKEIQHLAAICRHCGGGDWILESGVKCTSLACSVFYERRKVQKDLQGLSSVAAEKGFYPKCTIEWF